MAKTLTNSELYLIGILCEKVEEVVDNNDWPTEEGQDREGSPSYISNLVRDIRRMIIHE